MKRWRWRIAAWIAPDPIFHSWDLARYDRVFYDREGIRYILEGNAGHSYANGFHHGFREGCVICRRGGPRNTADLPLRFRDVGNSGA